VSAPGPKNRPTSRLTIGPSSVQAAA